MCERTSHRQPAVDDDDRVAADPDVLAVVVHVHPSAAPDLAALRDDGILVRRVAGYGLPAALRITVGDEDGVTRVLDSLGRFMADRRGA